MIRRIKTIILFLLVAILLVFAVMWLSTQSSRYKDEINVREKRIENLEKQIKHNERVNDSLKSYIDTLNVQIVQYDKEIIESKTRIEELEWEGKKKVEEVQEFTSSEADSLLEKRYPDKDTRSKNIVTDLVKGDVARELNVELAQQIRKVESKGIALGEVITSQEMIILNLENSLEKSRQINDEREAQLNEAKKEVRRQKRHKVITGIVGGIAVVLSLFSAK